MTKSYSASTKAFELEQWLEGLCKTHLKKPFEFKLPTSLGNFSLPPIIKEGNLEILRIPIAKEIKRCIYRLRHQAQMVF